MASATFAPKLFKRLAPRPSEAGNKKKQVTKWMLWPAPQATGTISKWVLCPTPQATYTL